MARKPVKEREISKKVVSKVIIGPKTKKEKQKTAVSESYVVIDYPVEAEVIESGHYAIRIGASNDGYVEISFNDGEWIPCRFTSGYWWFDWMYFEPGEHTLAVRLVDLQGNTILETEPRKCKYGKEKKFFM